MNQHILPFLRQILASEHHDIGKQPCIIGASKAYVSTENWLLSLQNKVLQNSWLNYHNKTNHNQIMCIFDGVHSGRILGLHPANERRRYKVTPSLIGWVQT